MRNAVSTSASSWSIFVEEKRAISASSNDRQRRTPMTSSIVRPWSVGESLEYRAECRSSDAYAFFAFDSKQNLKCCDSGWRNRHGVLGRTTRPISRHQRDDSRAQSRELPFVSSPQVATPVALAHFPSRIP